MSDKWFRRSSWTPENQDDFWQHYNRCRSARRKLKALITQAKHISGNEPEQAELLLNKLIIELKPNPGSDPDSSENLLWYQAQRDLADLVSKRGDHTAAAEMLLKAAEYDTASEPNFQRVVLENQLSDFYDAVRRQLELRPIETRSLRQENSYTSVHIGTGTLVLTQLVLEYLEGNTAKLQDLADQFFTLLAKWHKFKVDDVFWTSFAGGYGYSNYSPYYLRILHEVCGRGGKIFMLGLLAADSDLTPETWFSKLKAHSIFSKAKSSKSETQVSLKTETTIFDFRWLTKRTHLEIAAKPLFKVGIKIPPAKYAFIVTCQALNDTDEVNHSIDLLTMIESFDEFVYLNNWGFNELKALSERVCNNPRAVVPVFATEEQRLDDKSLDKLMRKFVLPSLRELGFQHVTPTKAERWDQNDNRYCQLLFTRNRSGSISLQVKLAIYFADQIPKDRIKRYLNKAGRLSFRRYVHGSYSSIVHEFYRPCPDNHKAGWDFSEMTLDYGEKLLLELADQLKNKLPVLLEESDSQK